MLGSSSRSHLPTRAASPFPWLPKVSNLSGGKCIASMFPSNIPELQQPCRLDSDTFPRPGVPMRAARYFKRSMTHSSGHVHTGTGKNRIRCRRSRYDPAGGRVGFPPLANLRSPVQVEAPITFDHRQSGCPRPPPVEPRSPDPSGHTCWTTGWRWKPGRHRRGRRGRERRRAPVPAPGR